MIRKICSVLVLVLGFMIALGSLGHGIAGTRSIQAELSKFPISTNVYTMLMVVWYFVSGCMALFGAAVIWSWYRVRRGDTDALFVTYLVGGLYAVVGIGGMIYRNGDPFMSLFIIEGCVLLAAGMGLRVGGLSKRPVPQRSAAKSFSV